jgi:superfamily II DNA or RNA helicase
MTLKTQPDQINKLEEEIKRLSAECDRLREENDRLREQIRRNPPGIPTKPIPQEHVPEGAHKSLGPPPAGIVHTPPLRAPSASSADDKVALFRKLFRGRDDVYAKRWENKSGRSGYSPACKNEWVRHVCRKPCSRCNNADYLPLTDQIIREHLSGKRTIGVYPLMLDETCWFLAADFDGDHWHDDAFAFLAAANQLGVPAYLERSRSGKGGHIWIFFDRPLDASIARDLGATILTRAMDSLPELSFNSYDRFFPNQGTMPKGGFGNLIALPLQRSPVILGNSVFANNNLEPYPDQWAYLSEIRRMSSGETVTLVQQAVAANSITGVHMSSDDQSPDNGADSVDPWTTPCSLPPSCKTPDEPIPGPLPETVRIVRANMVYIEKKGLPTQMLTRLRRLAAFQNPEFYRAQRMRLLTFDKHRVICCAENYPCHLALPRGCLDKAISLLSEHGISPIIEDERFLGTPADFAFHGELSEVQKEAMRTLLTFDDGVLSAPTGFGKTVVGASIIASRKVNTLVLVHRRQLLDQWRAQLATFLQLPPECIGQIGGGKVAPNGKLDVGMIQSLNRSGVVDDIVGTYGHMIVDECHHVSAVSFEQVLKQVKAKYVLGLTATPVRKDGHHPIIMMQCGPLRMRIGPRHESLRKFKHIVLPRKTSFKLSPDAEDATIHQVYAMLALDWDRNAMTLADIIKAVRSGRSPLVLTERTAHLKLLATELRKHVKNVIVLRGGRTEKHREQARDKLASISGSEERVIVATGRYIGEGFDDARLDTLFLTLPISWRGTIQQQRDSAIQSKIRY